MFSSTLNNVNVNLLIFILAVIIFSIYTYHYYNIIMKINHKLPLSCTSKNHFRFLKYSLSSVGAIVPYGQPIENEDFIYEAPSTIVELTDAELNELMQIVFAEIGNSHLISVELLQSLGLYTDTVVSLLTSLGYIIL
jgi:hypothetical protein